MGLTRPKPGESSESYYLLTCVHGFSSRFNNRGEAEHRLGILNDQYANCGPYQFDKITETLTIEVEPLI